MAKSRKKRNRIGGFTKRHRKNPSVHRHHHMRRNPLLPVPAGDVLPTLGGGLAGAVGSSYGASLILGSKDVGFFGYLANLAIAVVGAYLLKSYPKLAFGWFFGGVLMTGGRIIDDVTGKQILVVSNQNPLGVSAYYGKAYAPLPITLDRQLGYGNAPALPAAPAPGAKLSSGGMGWAQTGFARRVAA